MTMPKIVRAKYSSDKKIRFGMVLTEKQKNFIMDAVGVSCQSLSAFVLGAAMEEAARVLDTTFLKWQKGGQNAAPTKADAQNPEKIRCTK